MNDLNCTANVAEECWRPIAHWPFHYVSNMGRVKRDKFFIEENGRRVFETKFFAPSSFFNNYMYVYFKDDSDPNPGCFPKLVHCLVADAFIPRQRGMHYVLHKDNDRTNNCVSNLERCTFKQFVNHTDRKFLPAWTYASVTNSKRVDMIDPATGEVIETYDSVIYAAMMNDISDSTISACLHGRLKTAGGYIWKLSDIKQGTLGKQEALKALHDNSYADEETMRNNKKEADKIGDKISSPKKAITVQYLAELDSMHEKLIDNNGICHFESKGEAMTYIC